MLRWHHTSPLKKEGEAQNKPIKQLPLIPGQLVAIGKNQICDVKIISKQLDGVHMLLRLSADGSEIMVMENLTENGVVKIFDENSRMHLSPQTAYTYPAKGINHTFMCGDVKVEYLHQNIDEPLNRDNSEQNLMEDPILPQDLKSALKPIQNRQISFGGDIDPTLILPKTGNPPKFVPKVPAFDFDGATQIIPKPVVKNQVYEDATLILPKNFVKKEEPAFNMEDATLILPQPIKNDDMGFDPTIIIPQGNFGAGAAAAQIKKKTEIEALLEEDNESDDSPRFGKKGMSQIGHQRKIVKENVDDIMDELDNTIKAPPTVVLAPPIVIQAKVEEKEEEKEEGLRGQYNKKRKLEQIGSTHESAKKEEPQSQGEGLDKNKRRRVITDDSQERPKKQIVVLVGGKAKDDKYKKIIQQLGGKYIEDLDEQFDFYVTDDKLVRNSKLLLAIASGAHVVGIKWIEDSQRERAFIIQKADKYHIIDKKFEEQYSCKLENLYRTIGKTQSLLKGQRVYLSPNIAILSKAHMKIMVESLGANVVGDSEKDAKSANVCFLDTDKDKKMQTVLKAIKKDRPVMSSIIAIFDGILRQNVVYDDYEL